MMVSRCHRKSILKFERIAYKYIGNTITAISKSKIKNKRFFIILFGEIFKTILSGSFFFNR